MPQTNTYDMDRLYPIIPGGNWPHEQVIGITLPVGGTYGSGIQFPKGCLVGPTGVAKRDEIRTIALTGAPTGAKVTVTYQSSRRTVSKTTANLVTTIPTAAEMTTMLEGIFGTGNIAVVKTSLSYEITFKGILNEREIGGILTPTATFTAGTAPTVTHTRTQIGSVGAGQWDKYEDSVVPKAVGALVYNQDIDEANGQVTENGFPGQPSASPVTTRGVYRIGDLVGLDANAVADLGKIINGVLADPEGWIAFNAG